MRRTAVVVLPLIALLAGCSGGGDSGSSSTAAMDSAGDKAAPAGAPAAGGGAVQPVVDKAKPISVPRSLIRTAELEVRVDNVKKAAAAAERAAESVGGEVSDEELDLHTASPTATLQLRVPPARLSATLTRLSELGDEQSRLLGTDDVTDQVIDLESRLATQRTSVARVRALLDRATSLTDVVRIEAELSRREADLESLQQRARALSGQVDMATITLALTTRDEKPKVAASVGFRSGLEGGWSAFTATARVAGATVGALLPFLPLVAVVIGAALWWRRRVSAA
jgi:hypothetical protein